MKLTSHFTLEEFTRSQTAARFNILNDPDGHSRINIQRLAETLEAIRTALSGKSIQITSGYRCNDLNRRIGGSKSSAHMDGRAADIVVRGMTPLQAARAIQGSGIVLDQVILEGSWVHVGIARVGDVARGDFMTARFGPDGVKYQRGIIAA